MGAVYQRRLTNSSELLDILKCRREDDGKGSGNMGNPVTTFEITGKDLKALGAFYQGAFDWRLGTPQPAYTMVYPAEDHPVVGVLTPAQPGTSGHARFYIEVNDFDAAL